MQKKLLGFIFMKDKRTSEMQRKQKTGLSFCAEGSTRCKETQWYLLNSHCSLCYSMIADTQAITGACHQITRKLLHHVIRYAENCTVFSFKGRVHLLRGQWFVQSRLGTTDNTMLLVWMGFYSKACLTSIKTERRGTKKFSMSRCSTRQKSTASRTK